MATTFNNSSNPCGEAIPLNITTTTTIDDDDADDVSLLDDISRRLRQEALDALENEPELTMLLHNTVLAPGVRTFEDAVATTITYRLLLRPCHGTATKLAPAAPSTSSPMMFCPNSLRGILAQALHPSNTHIKEGGHTMAEAVRRDVMAVVDRDPAVDSLLEVVLFLKGFAALVCHRAAYFKWHSSQPSNNNNTSNNKKKSMTALWLQSQASSVFGLDIHPGATMGAGILLDHGTGVVIGETATVGDGCTLLHGVTLGGTGKDGDVDRHPKVGRDVLIGANASLLGNIIIGHGAKIGAGSIVLGPIPSGATAVGAPAKIIGRAKEAQPALTMDERLHQVLLLHKSASSATMVSRSSTATTRSSTTSSGSASGAVTTTNSTSEGDGTGDSNDEKIANKDTGTAVPKDIRDKDDGNTDSDDTDHTNCCCPFRDFVHLAQFAPQGSITICTLRRILNPVGCTHSEVGEVLFALDTRNVGYIKPEIFFGEETHKCIVECTHLDAAAVQDIMADFHEQWSNEQTLLGGNGAKMSTPLQVSGVVFRIKKQ